MAEVQITRGAVATLYTMMQSVNSDHAERLASADPDNADIAEIYRESYDKMAGFAANLLSALNVAGMNDNTAARMFGDLDSVAFTGAMEGAIINHGKGEIRTHT